MLTLFVVLKLAVSAVILSAFLRSLAQCIRNIFFHPYAKYPGPFLARITPLYSLWHAYIGDLHLDALRCHEEYGPFVRYAPDRLLVNTVEGIKAVYGQGKNFKKSRGYAPHPYFPTQYNTHNCIDKDMHGRKRRIVAQGFSEPVMAASEPYILDHVRSLCSALVEGVENDEWSEPRDMADWTNYFTLDVISELALGKPLNMLTDDSMRWLMSGIIEGNRHIYMRFACPWLFNVNPQAWYATARWLFPELATERDRFADVVKQRSMERILHAENGNISRRDILNALIEARDPRSGDRLTMDEVLTETHLMIAAGGDTTSTAFAAVLFYLSRNRAQYSKLCEEIRSTFDNIDQIHRGPKLSNCRYLRACIDEALRVAPAAPGALWRESEVSGAVVDGEYIPPGMDVGTCTYALQHDADYFHEPFSFRPERFLVDRISDGNSGRAASPAQPLGPNQSSMDNFDAYVPFSIGSRSCPARPVAYLELTLALAHITYLFEFEPVSSLGEGGPGKGRGRERVEEFQIIDMFSSNKEGPVLRFRRRQAADHPPSEYLR